VQQKKLVQVELHGGGPGMETTNHCRGHVGYPGD
jgi:hypothetical protein